MNRTLAILALLVIGIMIFSPVVLATETLIGPDYVFTETTEVEKTTVMTSDGVQAISPEEGVNRLNSALMSLYHAGASVIPNLALIALVVGAVIVMFAAALSLEKLLKISALGMAVVLIAVVIVYAAPFLTAMAKGFGAGL